MPGKGLFHQTCVVAAFQYAGTIQAHADQRADRGAGPGLPDNGRHGDDDHAAAASSYEKKPVNGLETAEFQAGLFDSIPYEQQAKELVNYIDSADENKKATRQLAELYIHQDLDSIGQLSDKDDPGHERLYGPVIV
jgi:uncharacterized protein YbaP (TraB family)